MFESVDFGVMNEDEISQIKGPSTLLFMAPELYDNGGDDDDEFHEQMNKVDVYSFGFILIYIVTNSIPKYNLKRKITGISPKLPSTVVPWVVELIDQCLQVTAENRPTFKEIFEILKSHNFDLFEETSSSKLTAQQKKSKKEIEKRILKIEAFEYQHRQ